MRHEQRTTAPDGTPIAPENLLKMDFDPSRPGRVIIRSYDDSTYRGPLEQETIAFRITPDLELDLHTGQMVSIERPYALPPEATVKQVAKLVARLSAPNFRDREEAQEALIRMGRGNRGRTIIPLIRKHLKDADPEVRQRIGVVLDKLGAGESSGPRRPNDEIPVERLRRAIPVGVR